jgi:hypothetical protein
MKKLFFAAAIVCLFALGAFAQKSADLSGKWNLDISKSDLGQQAAMIKSQTVTITQSGTSFKVSTQTERNAPPADSAGGGGGGRGFGGGMGGGAGEQSYTLDGKEVSTDRQTPNGTITTKTTASQSGNKVMITSVFPGPNGDIKSTTTYELSADGKSLTVTRESPRGSTKSVYTKG